MNKEKKISQKIEGPIGLPVTPESRKPTPSPEEEPPTKSRATGFRLAVSAATDLWRRSVAELRANCSDALAVVHDIRERVRNELSHRVAARRTPRKPLERRTPDQAPLARRINVTPLRVRSNHSDDQLPPRRADSLEPEKAFAPHEALGNEAERPFRHVLVVGGMDFLGAALVGQLNAMGFQEITVTDGLNEGNILMLPTLKFQEFLSAGELEKIVAADTSPQSGYSHIFYLGGWQAESMALTKSLLAHAVKSGARFLAVSSASSLGPRQPCAIEERHDPENFRPLTPDGLVSCLFDRYARSRAPKRSYISLKHYRLFGPGEGEDGGLCGLIRSSQLQSDGSIRLPAALKPASPEGLRKFDFLPVEEAASIALHLAQSHLATGVYELGSGASATPEALARAAIAARGGVGEIVWDAKAGYAPPSPQPEQAFLGRLVEAGWKPSPPSLDAAVKHYLNGLEAGLEPGEPPAQPAAP
ncbi:MAG: NAD-dependent epimerase/dehydratase family protein, partial [Verrucomicrobiota bacterium]